MGMSMKGTERDWSLVLSRIDPAEILRVEE